MLLGGDRRKSKHGPTQRVYQQNMLGDCASWQNTSHDGVIALPVVQLRQLLGEWSDGQTVGCGYHNEPSLNSC